jgi:hypothetical protein
MTREFYRVVKVTIADAFYLLRNGKNFVVAMF